MLNQHVCPLPPTHTCTQKFPFVVLPLSNLSSQPISRPQPLPPLHLFLPQGRVCNGRGTCSCNQCSGCQAPFTGVYCQSCQASTPGACASFLCQPNLVCAQCALGQVNNTLCSSCPSLFLLNTTDISSIQGRLAVIDIIS